MPFLSFRRAGFAGPPGSSSSCLSLRPLGLCGQVAEVGGPQAPADIACQACSQGQCRGRWIRVRRAEPAIRAGSLMS